jgi:hypothetical protein
MRSSFANHFFMAILGLFMGAIMAYTGFSNFNEVHSMFIFSDFRLLFGFAGAVGLAMVGFALLGQMNPSSNRKITGTANFGGIMFGVGWAITGACPTIALVQLGQGQLAALFTVAGIFLGVWGYRYLSSGTINLGSEICGED